MRSKGCELGVDLSLPPGDWPLYPLPQAARYLGVPLSTLRAWVQGRTFPRKEGEGRSEALIIPPSPAPLLSFNNLVEANVLAALRRVHGVSMPRVRRALLYAREKLGHERPLLLDLRAGLGEIFLEDPAGLVALSRGGAIALKGLLEHYLSRVERDERGFPLRYHPFVPPKEEVSRAVVLDPQVAFGAPNVRGVRTEVLARRYDLGEDLESLAQDYGLTPQEVEEAIRFERAA